MTRPILGKRRTPISCTAKGGGSGVIIETVGLSHYHPLLLQSPPFPAKLSSKKGSPSLPASFFWNGQRRRRKKGEKEEKRLPPTPPSRAFFNFLDGDLAKSSRSRRWFLFASCISIFLLLLLILLEIVSGNE